MKCRHCQTPLTHELIDLGNAPPSNAYLTRDKLKKPELWFPLRVLVCHTCWLVQTEDFADFQALFDEDYAYFSSFSTSWLKHSEQYTREMTERFGLDQDSHVVEVAANDGYLLQYFKQNDVPCLGVEPTASTAQAARDKGIEIVQDFFSKQLGASLSQNGKAADLTAANNVLAHVPDINDFVSGFAQILKPNGVSTFEFPSLSQLIKHRQFDTIYHEHFSYLSLTAVKTVFEANGLSVFDVQHLPTHGGSLRVFAQRSDTGQHKVTDTVQEVLDAEKTQGLTELTTYRDFEARSEAIKDELVATLIKAKVDGKKVAAYGAAAKGNTFMNYAGIRPDLIQFVVDRNPAKQDRFMPGSRIPIVDEEHLKNTKPDYVVILPWNLKDEIADQLSYAREWGAKFVTAIPNLQVF